MNHVTVAKFGGSALGIDGILIPKIIDRIKQMKEESKVVAVFSAPLINYEEKVISMTDVAIKVGRNYASSNPIEIEVLREVYERIANEHVTKKFHNEFFQHLDKFYHQVIVSLKQATENKRF
ncbi:MAG TPA: aspartate kinase, partial [Nitrososphaeraceae archaeon]|nr:aspartate kinase [Nitrososphaeraceae archaeon]